MPELPLSLFADEPVAEAELAPEPIERDPLPFPLPPPGGQLVITRPNGTVLVQAVPMVPDGWSFVEGLAPLLPPDAIWQVRPKDAPTPWDRTRSL